MKKLNVSKIGNATVHVNFVPKGNTRVRPANYMNPEGTTVHNTANPDAGADAEMHNRYLHNQSALGINAREASFHFNVDDHSIWQNLPLDENAWHAGDGHGFGNMKTVSIEICENSDGDYAQAEANAIALIVYLSKHLNISVDKVRPHQYYSGKWCPHKILESDGKWRGFHARVRNAYNGGDISTEVGTNTDVDTSSNGGKKVTLKKSAKNYATGESIPSSVKGKKYTVQQEKSDRVLLKEIYSWVKVSDIVENKQSKPTESTSSSKLTVGSKVTLLNSATKYATGQSIPASKKGKKYTIQQVKSDRVLLKEIYSWVYTKDVSGGSSNTNTSTKVSFKVGNKVTLSNSATKYATGQSIPPSKKGKKYTIQQVKSDRVLLKEIYSWVFKKDVGAGSGSTGSSAKTKIKSVGKIKMTGVNNYTYIYASTSDKSKRLGKARKNKVFSIAGSVPNWYEVIYKGQRAYIKSKYASRA